MPHAEKPHVEKPDAGNPARDAVKATAYLPFIVAATFFMEYLDTTIIATALPQMARSFAVDPNQVSLGMTAYMLTLAVCIPISGWVADRVGSRTVFGGAIAIFVFASLLCGMSNTLDEFVAARVLQGVGGAMMVPVGRMIVVRNTEKSRLMQAISTITWPGIVAPVIGPAVGGFITTYASWHWIFFLNVPFGVAAFAAVMALVPQQRAVTKRRLDLGGFALSGAALVALLYGTELASHQEASLASAAGFILAGVLIGLVAIKRARTVRDPLLDLTTLRIPTYAVTVLWGSGTRIGIEAVTYLSPLLFQIGFGLSAFRSGLLLMAAAIGNLSMKLFTTPILRRFGFRGVAIVNSAIAGAATIAFGWLAPSTPIFATLAILMIYGLSRSLQFTTLATLAYADVGDAQKSAASTLWSVAQQMTIGMGIAFGALCLRISASFRGGDVGLDRFSIADFRWAFVLAGVLTLVSVVGYVRLPRNAGRSISGRGT